MFSQVKLPHAFSIPAVFFSYEARGISCKPEGAAGSIQVTPEQALPAGLDTGSKILLNYEFRYVQANRSGTYQSQAGVRAILVAVSMNTPDLAANGAQNRLKDVVK
jgi:hypothetical protein